MPVSSQSFYKFRVAWIKVTVVILIAFVLGFALTPVVAQGQGLLTVLKLEPPRVSEFPELADPAYGLIHLQRLALLLRIIGKSIQIIGAFQFFSHAVRGTKQFPKWKLVLTHYGKAVMAIAGAELLVFMLQQLTVVFTATDPFA